MLNKKYMDKAIQLWSVEKQIDMVIEECAELIVSINHYRRNRVTYKEVLEECVDVEMMLDQLKNIIGHEDIYKEIHTKKENRFYLRLIRGEDKL